MIASKKGNIFQTIDQICLTILEVSSKKADATPCVKFWCRGTRGERGGKLNKSSNCSLATPSPSSPGQLLKFKAAIRLGCFSTIWSEGDVLNSSWSFPFPAASSSSLSLTCACLLTLRPGQSIPTLQLLLRVFHFYHHPDHHHHNHPRCDHLHCSHWKVTRLES